MRRWIALAVGATAVIAAAGPVAAATGAPASGSSPPATSTPPPPPDALGLAMVVWPRAHPAIHVDVAYPDILRPDGLAAAALRAQHARRLGRRRVALVRLNNAYFRHQLTPNKSRM